MTWQQLHAPFYGAIKVAHQPDQFTLIELHYWRVEEDDDGERLQYMTIQGSMLNASTFSYVTDKP